jgi:hypothetical protein
MAFLWDYDKKTLESNESGRIKLLERAINFGPAKGERIKLSEVIKYWKRLDLFPKSRMLFELLIWGKYQSLTTNKKQS